MKKSFLLTMVALISLTLVMIGAAMAEAGQLQSDPMAIPTDAPTMTFDLPQGYDPASEEDHTPYNSSAVYDDYGHMKYAGATPIPLDPIDMPTPTPKPTYSFSFGMVPADKIGLSFEAPVGWQIDASADDSVTLIEPNTVDGYNAKLIVRMTNVASSYRTNDLKSDLRSYIKELGQYNYSRWSSTELANRTIMKKDGFYADYEGTYYDGTMIYGRVMMALLDGNKVITVHLSCPDGYFNSSYKAVINHVRDTLKLQ